MQSNYTTNYVSIKRIFIEKQKKLDTHTTIEITLANIRISNYFDLETFIGKRIYMHTYLHNHSQIPIDANSFMQIFISIAFPFHRTSYTYVWCILYMPYIDRRKMCVFLLKKKKKKYILWMIPHRCCRRWYRFQLSWTRKAFKFMHSNLKKKKEKFNSMRCTYTHLHIGEFRYPIPGGCIMCELVYILKPFHWKDFDFNAKSFSNVISWKFIVFEDTT